jgi:histidinol-phosphate/aromatic aminotransferase/cobyric acid decarboxylase-like protein
LSQQPHKLVFLASPNNPTGQTLELDLVFALAGRHHSTLFALDEVYGACLACVEQVKLKSPANVLRLRSLTKAHGLAGVRLGYALGARDVIAALRAAQPPWSVNAIAQAAGLAALGDECRLQDELRIWNEAKVTLVNLLSREAFAPVPSATPFFLLPVGSAKQIRALLLRRGLLVRDCTSFGLPEYIRVCARLPHDNARLVEALAEARAGTVSCHA